MSSRHRPSAGSVTVGREYDVVPADAKPPAAQDAPYPSFDYKTPLIRGLAPALSVPFRVLVFPSSNEPGLEVIQALARTNKVEVLGGSSYGGEWDPSRLWVHRHLDCPALGDVDF